MSAQRKLIRRAAASHLMVGIRPGVNVFSSRSAPLWAEYELPAICVYCTSETITLEQESPRKYRRELELRIEVAATGRDVDDQLDDIGQAVEQCIGRSDRLKYQREHPVADIQLSSEQIEFRPEGEQVIGALLITYNAVYYSFEPDEFDPEPIDDLARVHTDYNLDGKQATADQASDMVDGLDR